MNKIYKGSKGPLHKALRQGRSRNREVNYNIYYFNRILKATGLEHRPDTEHSILSRIEYPDRSTALLYGRTHHALSGQVSERKAYEQYLERPTKLAIGIASIRRDPDTGYLEQVLSTSWNKLRVSYCDLFFFVVKKTIGYILSRTSPEDKSNITIVICLTDANSTLMVSRANYLYHKYSEHVDTGLIQVPPI